MKNYLMAAAVAAALLAPLQTRAATINLGFTLTNVAAGVVVTGEADGLTVGATSTPSAVSITGYTQSLLTYFTFPTPLSLTFTGTLADGSTAADSFTVDGSGVLTAATFRGDNIFATNAPVALPFGNGTITATSAYVILAFNGSSEGGFSGGVQMVIVPLAGPEIAPIVDGSLDFAAVSQTPLPAALPLFATGLGGLGLLGWRRKRAPLLSKDIALSSLPT